MYSFPNLQPVWCSMSGSNCCFLTCIHISQEAGKVVWYSNLFQKFPQFVVIHRVIGFDVVNEAEVYVFLELSCFFDDSTDIGNLISGSFAFSKSRLNTSEFLVHILLKLSLQNFKHHFASMWNECSCTIVWTFFGIALLLDWNENWPFPVLWPLLSFPNLLAYWVQHFNSIIFQALKELSWNSIASTASFAVMLPEVDSTLHLEMSSPVLKVSVSCSVTSDSLWPHGP